MHRESKWYEQLCDRMNLCLWAELEYENKNNLALSKSPMKVFNGFDLLLLLSSGHTTFFGPARNAVEYFASIGRCIPEGMIK